MNDMAVTGSRLRLRLGDFRRCVLCVASIPGRAGGANSSTSPGSHGGSPGSLLLPPPMAVFVVASVAAVPGVVAAGPIEARVTGAVLAAMPLLGVALLVRFRRWPE